VTVVKGETAVDVQLGLLPFTVGLALVVDRLPRRAA
jgi:hypothetical protein